MPAESLGASPRVRVLANNISIVSTLAGDVLVNSPPETLKYLVSAGLTPPALVLLPPDIPPGQQLGSSGFVRQGINYASVEFLMYSNFFGRGGQRTRLITVTADQARRLQVMLDETTNGPAEGCYEQEEWLRQECNAISHYPPLGRELRCADMVDITSLEQGGGQIGPLSIRLSNDRFIFAEHSQDVAEVSTAITQAPMPLTLAPPRPLLRQELTLQFIGGSDGFDPAGITTCFLAYLGSHVETQATLFDAAAYLRVRLGNLGLSPNQISEVVLSHLHEDHLAGLPELLLMGGCRVRLVTSTIIYRSLLRVLSAMLAVGEPHAAALFDYYPLNPGQPLQLEQRSFEAIYAVHSIPTIAVRANALCYSGDMRYDEDWFAELEQQGVLSAARRQELLHFAEGASILVQDVGGGAVHTTLTPALLQRLAAKSQRIVLAHTSKHALPDDQSALADKVEFAGSGHVVAMGEVIANQHEVEQIETLSACPLFARLPISERLALAEQSQVTEWQDGQVIVAEGDAFDGRIYVVHSGLVEVWSKGELRFVLGRGNSIGERGALQGDARIGSLVSRGAVQLLLIDGEVFGPAASKLGLAEAISRADWLRELPDLINLPWATLLDLALDFQPRQVQSGEQLFGYGELGYEGYMLVSGTVAILNQEGQPLGDVVKPGEFFGGRSPLYGKPRRASGVMAEPGMVWALPAQALQRLQMVYPNMLLHMGVVE